MKKLIWLTVVFVFLFTGCVQDTMPPDTSESTNAPSQNSENNITFSAKVIKNFGDSMLAADIDGDINSIMLVPSGDCAAKAGDIVSITYNGMRLESYPLQLGHPTVALKEEGDDLVGLYCDIFFELWERDSGLNDDVNMISVDLSNTNNLSDAEKKGLLYIIDSQLSSDTEIQVVGMTFEQLKEENMLSYEDGNDKFPYFENGVLFTFPTEKESEKNFELTATKWRSSLGAYGFNVKASLDGNTWKYKIENEFIS